MQTNLDIHANDFYFIFGRWEWDSISNFFYMTGKQCMFTKKKKKVSRGLTLLNVYYSVDIGPVNTSLRDHEQRFG